MKRRNTIDNLHGDWPIVQYYYTHNNGSCDDILIHHKSLNVDATTTKQINKKHQSDYKNRRKTFPQEKIAVEFQQCQNGRRDSNKIKIIATTAASPIIRGWSTAKKQQQQQKNRKKRETLANIISNLSRSNSSTVTGSNISSSNNDDTIRMESDLDIKWETIRQYNPQLDSEKILEQDDDDDIEYDEGYSQGPMSQEQKNDAVVVDINNSSSSSNDSNGLFLPAGQDNTVTTTNTTTTDDIVAIPIDPNTLLNNEIVYTTAKAHPTVSETNLIPMSINIGHTDMFLFLFGFVFFPLWWIGTWRFFMQPDKIFLHKQQRGFQIVNCCMTLASLLMTGLIIGLVTVWA